jgi:hypothetical protein
MHSAGILEQYMWGQEPSRNRVVVTAHQAAYSALAKSISWNLFMGLLKV